MNLEQAGLLVEKLRRLQHRLVLAESCTGGLAAARLTSIAGASDILCGSMVTYRENTKKQWLGVSEETLTQFSAVSEEVTLAMASAILNATPEASVAAAITGHLGPHAPEELDGIIFAAVAIRQTDVRDESSGLQPSCVNAHLKTTERVKRQHEAAGFLLSSILDFLS